MRIVVNHLTRMRAPRICVAGINPETSEHVRPTTARYDPLTRSLLRADGGPLRVGALVDVGEGRSDPSPPELEDYRIGTRQIRHVQDLPAAAYLAWLDEVASPSLEAAFGPDLERVGWKVAVDRGGGCRSLAVVRPRSRPRLEIDSKYGKLQLRFDDPDPPTYLSVTDIRFFEPDDRERHWLQLNGICLADRPVGDVP